MSVKRAGAGALLALLLCAGAAQRAQAQDLAMLIRDAAVADPAVLEAGARQEQASMQTARSRAGHWPVLGLTASTPVGPERHSIRPSRGLSARMNLFSAGAISAQVRRDEFHEQFYAQKTAETRESLAWQIAQQYLAALRAQEMHAAEAQNLKRHEKIIADLQIVVQYDQGRQYELVQAQARALAVRMRMVQYEKAQRLALSKLSRYSAAPIALSNPFGENWQKGFAVRSPAQHPSVLAQQRELDGVRAELSYLKRARWPSVDLVANKALSSPLGHSTSASVVLNWNFIDGQSYYSQQGAARQLSAAQNRAEVLQRELSERAQTAQADMSQSLLQAAAARQQITASQKVVELYEMQFRIARRSLLELLNAYGELASVESALVAAENDYRVAVSAWLEAHAALLDWANAATAASASAPALPPSPAASQASPTSALSPQAAAQPPERSSPLPRRRKRAR